MQERHAGFQRDEVRHARQVHHLLHRRGRQHGETGLPGGHDVLVVAENGERLRRQRPRRDVEHARKQLTRDLVHIGNHQQQSLRRGEGRGESASLQGAVHRPGSTRLGLHFDHFHGFTEHISTPLGGPFVHQFRHRRGGRDGIDRSDLGEHVGHVSRRVISIAGDKLFFCHVDKI